MLEILAVVGMCKAIGGMARDKGRSAFPYQLLSVLFWFGGEIVGAIVGVILKGGAEGDFDFTVYLAAIAGAVLGCGLAFLLITILPPVRKPDPYDARYRDRGVAS